MAKEVYACAEYSLHKFPASLECHREWVVVLNRKDFEPSRFARVSRSYAALEALFIHHHAKFLSHVSVLWRYVSVHFIDCKPTKINLTPVLQLGFAKTAS